MKGIIAMSVNKELYGNMPDGREVNLYILENEKGTRAEIINYGGIVTKLITKDKHGDDCNVVLGRACLNDYLNNVGYLGAAVGRHANRIAGSSFVINGKEYKTFANEFNNSLHGGAEGFNKKLWDAEIAEDENAVIMHYLSPDGEEGFPGNLDVQIKYSITDENGLKIEYRAISDKDTVCNLTNHSYFNLNGEKSGNILGHKLQMNSSFYTPNDRACMPTGEVLSVDNTPFDFRIRQTLGNGITSDFEQIRLFGGYDHNFILDGRGMRHAATLKGDKTGITMQMITDQPAVQIYTGNAIDEDVFNGDYQYHQHDAVCLETQAFPNSLKFAHFPDALLKAGEEYIHTVEYRFV